MAKKDHKVGEAIEVVYQAMNAQTDATINMEVYDETHTIVVGGPIVLTELGASGRYYGAFTPDTEGEWTVEIEKSDGSGKVVKTFSVGSHHLKDVGAKVDLIKNETSTLGTNLGIVEGKVDTTDAKVDNLDGDIVTLDAKVVNLDGDVVALDGKADVTHTKVDAVDAKITNLDGDIVAIDTKIDGLGSPPMVG